MGTGLGEFGGERWLGIERSAGGGGVVIQEVLGGWPGLQIEEGDRLDEWIGRR